MRTSPHADTAWERQHLEVVESVEHQEWRARQAVNWSVILKAGLGMGLFFFALPGGTPWTGAAFASTVMGHAVPWPWPVVAIVHFAVCLGYMTVLAHAVFRLQFVGALVTGAATGAALFAVTVVLFAPWAGMNMAPLIGHIFFGLFGTVAYKALAVPPPYTKISSAPAEGEFEKRRPPGAP